MKIAADNGTEEAPVQLVGVNTSTNSSSQSASNVSIVSQPKASTNETVEHSSGLAATAPLTEDGYNQVLALQDSVAMERYVKRVGEDLDIAVSSTGKRALKGFVPWFSGEKANRTLLRLQNEMVRISKIPRSWLTRKGASAPLNEVGLAAVASLKNNVEMAKFVRRVALEMMDMEVVEEEKLSGMVPFYSGLKGKKGFDVLLQELDTAAKANSSWLNLRHKALQNAGKDCMPTCNQKSGYCDWCGVGNACCKKGAEDGPEDCKGFAAVVALKNDTQMERFVRRKAAKMDMTVKSDQALRGFVPYFSGVKGNRPFGALEVEMRRIAHKTNGWLAPRGSTAPLTEDGYQTVASLGSSLEMAEFAHRVANDLNFDVIKEEGLKGMVPYYSGERTKSNLTTLKNEMTKVSSKPDGTGWLVPRKIPLSTSDKSDKK